MTPLVKFVLVLIGLAYLISPVDAIPELYLPWVGWIDDSLVILCLYHLLRYGTLPSFLFKKGAQQPFGKQNQGPDAGRPSPKGAPGRSRATGQSAQKDAGSGISKSPYEILGVDKSASWTEIQKAYKNKIKQYHPDKLSHLGDEFSHLANEKFLEIQQAYAKLKSIYNQGN